MSFQLNINLSLIEAQISFDCITWQRYWSPDVGRRFAFSTLLKPESEDSNAMQNIQIYLCYYEPNHSSDIRIDGTINLMKSDLRFSFGQEKHCFWCTRIEQKKNSSIKNSSDIIICIIISDDSSPRSSLLSMQEDISLFPGAVWLPVPRPRRANHSQLFLLFPLLHPLASSPVTWCMINWF